MGIVILRSMGGQHLDEEAMREINLAESAEIRRIVDRSFRRNDEEGRLPSVRASAAAPGLESGWAAQDSARDIRSGQIQADAEDAKGVHPVARDEPGTAR
ncbi:MAG: hypothetical protein LUE63_07230 [Lachnospiraceae bacterium]|nr:hypothetical protein [Lachnospiraceae bacterium]